LLLGLGLSVSAGAALAQDPAPAAEDEGPLLPYAPTPPLDALVERGELRGAMEGMGGLRLANEARRANNTLFEDGACRAVLEEGILVPVVNGGGVVPERPVGFVFFGDGTLEVDLKDSADATGFANHMVQHAGRDRGDFEAIAHGEAPYRTRFRRAFFLTADAQIADVLARLDPVGAGTVFSESRVGAGETIAEMVITDKKGQMKARALAVDILPNRLRALSEAGFDPVDFMQYDRAVHDLLGEPWRNLRLVAEFQTDDRYFVADTRKGDLPQDRWLTCLRDGLDHRGVGLASSVLAHGTDTQGGRHLTTFGGQRFRPRPSDGAPVPEPRVLGKYANVKVDVTPKKRMLWVHARVDATLQLQALDDDLRHVLMRVPRDEAIKGSFAITKLAMADGTPLDFMEVGGGRARDPDLGARMESFAGANFASAAFGSLDNAQNSQNMRFEDPKGAPMELLVVLPKAYARGQELELQLSWEADWSSSAFAAIQEQSGALGQSDSNAYLNLGVSTGAKRVLPDLVPDPGGTPWDFDLELGLPPKRIDAALSGETRGERTDDDGWYWQRSRGRDLRGVVVNVGRYSLLEEPAAEGLPAMRVYMQPKDAASAPLFPPELRRILVFLRRFMPLPPMDELDMIQGQAQLKEDLYNLRPPPTPAGMVGFSTIEVGGTTGAASDVRAENPFRTQTDLASDLVRQLWGQSVVPASARDAWMIDAMGETFGMFYVRAAKQAEGFEAFEGRLEYIRASLESPVVTNASGGAIADQDRYLSLTNTSSYLQSRPKVSSDYGFYLFARMLRERVGDQAYFSAIDRFSTRSRGKLVTTEDLQRAFEEASGQDLDPFFSYWVRGGFVPRVELEVVKRPAADGTVTVEGCVVTDVPFGRFDLPIAVWDDKEAARVDEKIEKAEKKGKEAALERKGVGGMVEVVDGYGAFTVEGRPATAVLEADPYGLILSYGRKVKEVAQTRCAARDAARLREAAPQDRPVDGTLDYDREKTPAP
jgi:hypothetical protein